ncbi:MAG: hypothetical protein LBS51_01700 [Oscillospiraceae bacterium]|jgi:uncharacterized membrane protein YjdF|nr:hypothetical protein [Oscillospiraceae bacterium]
MGRGALQNGHRQGVKLKALFSEIKNSIKRKPRLFALYAALRVFVVAVLVAQIFNANWENVLMCVLTLALFTIPTFIERQIKIDVPDTLEAIVLFFIFAAEILGEVHDYYESISAWDTMLHAANGFLAAAIGLALIDILNREDRFAISLSPVFVAVFAFCFSMTIGVVWEFFEFAMDVLFGADMQKDTVLGGYVDIGLYDTMKDLIVNFIGAAVFSAIGYFYIKRRGAGAGGHFVRRFILTKMGERFDEDIDGKISY